MILSNILLGILILFFGIQLVLAIRGTSREKGKICLISKKTGKIIELASADVSDLINQEIQADFTYTAQMIFTRLANAFALGHLAEVKECLSESALPVFQDAITAREKQHQKAEFSLIGFKSVKILEDAPNKKVVSFTTEQVNLLKDEKDNVIEGDPLYVATVTEDWTFVQKKENKWVVSAIQNREAHFA